MKTAFRFRVLTIIVFCAYIALGSFSGGDLTQSHNSLIQSQNSTEGFPYHRILMLLTAFIFLFNAQQVLIACKKNKLLITLLLYFLLTAIWANSPMETLKGFLFLSSVLIISLLTALAFSENKIVLIRWLFWLFLLLTLASIITALYFPNIGIKIGEKGDLRWIGITQHANALGGQSLLSIWLSSNLFFLAKSKIEKLIILFAICAAFYAILKADSMTSFITGIVISGYVCYYYLFWRLNQSIKIALYVIAALSFLITITFYMGTSELADTTLASTGRNTTFTGRSVLWESSLKYASNKLILGYGFDSLEQLTRKSHLQMSHLHNGYIETLVKGGLIASILLACILIKTFFHQLRIKASHKQDFILLNTGLIMLLLHNITESSILRGLSPLNIFIIFIIVSTSLIPLTNKDESLLASQ